MRGKWPDVLPKILPDADSLTFLLRHTLSKFNLYCCLFLCLCVCLSACISPKPVRVEVIAMLLFHAPRPIRDIAPPVTAVGS